MGRGEVWIPHLSDVDPIQHCFEAADVITVGVGQHEQVEVADPMAAQRRCVGDRIWTRVDGDDLAGRRAQQNGVALAHIEEDDRRHGRWGNR